jgi:hypothetical protein
MKLKITREGGFAALVIQKKIDTKRLPKRLQTSLETFIDKKRAPEPGDNPHLRDGYQYTIQWSGESSGKAQFDESNIPRELEPVIQFVLS